MQHRHLTASIVALSGSAASAASKITLRRCTDLPDNTRAAGRAIA